MKAPLLPNRYENPSLVWPAIALSMIQDEVPSEAEDKMLMTPTPAPATRTVRNRPFMISWPSRASWLTASLAPPTTCLLYTSDAADDLLCVDLGGRRIIKKK